MIKNLLKSYRHSISKQILAQVLAISFFATLITSSLQVIDEYTNQLDVLEVKFQLIETTYAPSIASAVWSLDSDLLKIQADGILKIPGIYFLELTNTGGIDTSYGQRPSDRFKSITIAIKHKLDDNTITSQLGELHVYADLNLVYDHVKSKIIFIILTQLAKTMIVSFLILLAINSSLTQHLVRITNFLKNLSFKDKNKLTLNRDKKFDDELTYMNQTINDMKQEIAKNYDDLERLNVELEDIVKQRTDVILEQQQQLAHNSKMVALAEMAGGVAHEVNNPITVVFSSAQILKKKAESQKLEPEFLIKTLDTILKTVSRISSVIQGLRDVAKNVNQDQMEHQTLKSVLTGALNQFTAMCKQSNVEFTISISSETEEKVIHCVPPQISEVVLNLLKNGLESAKDLNEKWVKLEASHNQHVLTVRITDSGHGIANDLVDKIFSPFFTTKEVGENMGLGLSISYGIVKSHQGNLFYDKSSKNTSFVIELPILGRN